MLIFGENSKVFEEKNEFLGKISDLWKIFGFGDNFGFWETFCILDEISNFRIFLFFWKYWDFVNFLELFLKCLVFRNCWNNSDFQMFYGGVSYFFWTNCRNSSWNLWTNFRILKKKKLDLWKNLKNGDFRCSFDFVDKKLFLGKLRALKSLNFPVGRLWRAKTFRTKCVIFFHDMCAKSA